MELSKELKTEAIDMTESIIPEETLPETAALPCTEETELEKTMAMGKSTHDQLKQLEKENRIFELMTSNEAIASVIVYFVQNYILKLKDVDTSVERIFEILIHPVSIYQ